MDKRGIITRVLIGIILVLFIVLVFLCIKQNKLSQEISDISAEKESIAQERDQILVEMSSVKDQLLILENDVRELEKSCIFDNACKGRFPGISWKCNNVGDLALENPSHICICNADCQLTLTPQ